MFLISKFRAATPAVRGVMKTIDAVMKRRLARYEEVAFFSSAI